MAWFSNPVLMKLVLFKDGVRRFREESTFITRQHRQRASSNYSSNSERHSINSNADSETDWSRQDMLLIINNKLRDRYLVAWNGPDDPQKPFNWSTLRKVGILVTISVLTISDPLASSMFSPALGDVALEFGESSSVLISFIVSVYLLGGGLGALLVGPASERYGRLPVYHIGNCLFVIFTIGCALANNTSSLIVFRFLEGCAGAVPLTIGGSTIRDILPPKERGAYMALWGLGSLMGPVLGPISGGAISEARGWRWVFWAVAMLVATISLVGIVILRETYEPALLRKKARAMRHQTGNESYYSHYDETKSIKHLFGPPVTRPLKLLALSPMVLFLSLHTAITSGYVYILFTTLPETFQEVYDFSRTQQGVSFIGLGLGLFIGLLISGIMSYNLTRRAQAKGTLNEPETILPLMIPGAVAIPIGLLLYGWSVQLRMHYMVPVFGTGLIGMGLVSTLIPIQSYLVEAFGIHSASAVAANVLLRSMMGAFLPLAGPALFHRLGLGWGSTLLGAVSFMFLPAPFIFIQYGRRLRENYPVKL